MNDPEKRIWEEIKRMFPEIGGNFKFCMETLAFVLFVLLILLLVKHEFLWGLLIEIINGIGKSLRKGADALTNPKSVFIFAAV